MAAEVVGMPHSRILAAKAAGIERCRQSIARGILKGMTMACCPARNRSRATPAIASLNVAASRTRQLNQRRQGQPFRFPSSVRLGSSEAAPSGFLLPGFNSSSAVPIAAMPPATIAAEAAFLATCLSFDGALEDDFLLGFADVLGFFDLAVLDLAPARREEGLTLARLAVFFINPPKRSWPPRHEIASYHGRRARLQAIAHGAHRLPRPAACPCVLPWA